jgi:hypothetical protein
MRDTMRKQFFDAVLLAVLLVALVKLSSYVHSGVSLASALPTLHMTATPGQGTASPSASQAIVRINQLDPRQYRSQQDYDTWSYSTCSTAAMTEVINAYGHQYRLADILQVEAAQGQITPELGLLYGESSIARTVKAFGFSARTLGNSSPDGIVAAAQAGMPVIVGFRDSIDFPSGHILVVRGGDAQHMEMVDSSKLNFQTISRAAFLHFYDGFAVLVTPGVALLPGGGGAL